MKGPVIWQSTNDPSPSTDLAASHIALAGRKLRRFFRTYSHSTLWPSSIFPDQARFKHAIFSLGLHFKAKVAPEAVASSAWFHSSAAERHQRRLVSIAAQHSF